MLRPEEGPFAHVRWHTAPAGKGTSGRQQSWHFIDAADHVVTKPRNVKDRCGRPGKGNDKGSVEGLAGYDCATICTNCPA